MNETHAQYRQRVRNHYGLSPMEMLTAGPMLRAWRRMLVVLRAAFGMRPKEY